MSSVLLLNNADVEKLLTMEATVQALDRAYLELDKGATANRPRTFTFSPTRSGRFLANTHEGILRNPGVYDIRIVTHSRPDPKIDPTRAQLLARSPLRHRERRSPGDHPRRLPAKNARAGDQRHRGAHDGEKKYPRDGADRLGLAGDRRDRGDALRAPDRERERL
jgi:hypothetical protein